jgi:selenocysteine lyase/cysteine desulfurase
MTLDLEFVRAQFPAFREPSLRGQAFFENAGGSFACRYVVWRLHRFYRERKVQPYGPYAASRAGGDEMDQARWRLAPMLGVETEELSFGPSTTANAYVLAQAFRRWLPRGAAIVVTDQDHEANSGPWRRLGEEGFEIREWRMDPETGHLDPAALTSLLEDGRVGLVAFPHCSNVVGEFNDVQRIVRIAKAAGARTVVDGVSYAPHGLPNVRKLGCDVYLFSAYKTYGPHQGLMVIRRGLGFELPAQGHFFNADTLHKRFTPAGPDHAQVAASAGIADYVDALYDRHETAGRDGAGRAEVTGKLMRAHETRLLARLMDALDGRNDVRVLGPRSARGRAPTVAMECARPGAAVAEDLARHGIMAGGGDFYAVRALRAMGVDPRRGVLRLSFLHYTTDEEMDRLLEALDRVL